MPLTPEQAQELRQWIEERRRALARELRRDAGRVRDQYESNLAGATHDRGEESVADLLADLGQAELSRDLAELRDLEAARVRIDGGTYGICADCGAEIAFERLRANPAAVRCISCQARHEKTHDGRGTPRL